MASAAPPTPFSPSGAFLSPTSADTKYALARVERVVTIAEVLLQYVLEIFPLDPILAALPFEKYWDNNLPKTSRDSNTLFIYQECMSLHEKDGEWVLREPLQDLSTIVADPARKEELLERLACARAKGAEPSPPIYRKIFFNNTFQLFRQTNEDVPDLVSSGPAFYIEALIKRLNELLKGGGNELASILLQAFAAFGSLAIMVTHHKQAQTELDPDIRAGRQKLVIMAAKDLSKQVTNLFADFCLLKAKLKAEPPKDEVYINLCQQMAAKEPLHEPLVKQHEELQGIHHALVSDPSVIVEGSITAMGCWLDVCLRNLKRLYDSASDTAEPIELRHHLGIAIESLLKIRMSPSESQTDKVIIKALNELAKLCKERANTLQKNVMVCLEELGVQWNKAPEQEGLYYKKDMLYVIHHLIQKLEKTQQSPEHLKLKPSELAELATFREGLHRTHPPEASFSLVLTAAAGAITGKVPPTRPTAAAVATTPVIP